MIITQKFLKIWFTVKVSWVRNCSRNDEPSQSQRLYGFETHLRDVCFFMFLPISFQMKNNDDMWL